MFVHLPPTYSPARPLMALASMYTGYTGSQTATTQSSEKMSPMLPQSLLAPSEIKISSALILAP